MTAPPCAPSPPSPTANSTSARTPNTTARPAPRHAPRPSGSGPPAAQFSGSQRAPTVTERVARVPTSPDGHGAGSPGPNEPRRSRSGFLRPPLHAPRPSGSGPPAAQLAGSQRAPTVTERVALGPRRMHRDHQGAAPEPGAGRGGWWCGLGWVCGGGKRKAPGKTAPLHFHFGRPPPRDRGAGLRPDCSFSFRLPSAPFPSARLIAHRPDLGSPRLCRWG